MKRNFIFFALLAFFMPLAGTLTLSGCADSEAAQWKKFSSQNGKFTLLMPGIPEAKESTIDTTVGLLSDHAFLLKARQGNYKAAYLISYIDYPSSRLKVSPQQFMEQAWQGSMGSFGSSNIYKKHISLNEYAGIEYQYKGKSGNLVTGRSYLVGKRLYQLTAIMSKEQFGRGDAMKYLGSFRVLK